MGKFSQWHSTSSLVAKAIALASILCRHSPTPIGRTPGCLSRAIPRHASRARAFVHSTTSFACSRVEVARASRSHSLSLPNLSRKDLHCSASVPCTWSSTASQGSDDRFNVHARNVDVLKRRQCVTLYESCWICWSSLWVFLRQNFVHRLASRPTLVMSFGEGI